MRHVVLCALFNVSPFKRKLRLAFAVCEASEGPRVREGPSQELPRSRCVLAPPNVLFPSAMVPLPFALLLTGMFVPVLQSKRPPPLKVGAEEILLQGAVRRGAAPAVVWGFSGQMLSGVLAASFLPLSWCEPAFLPG